MRLGVRRYGLPRRMRFSQSRISWTVSAKHPLPVPDHFWPTNLHRHQLHGGASSVQVSARPSDNVKSHGKRSCSPLVNKFPISNERFRSTSMSGSAHKTCTFVLFNSSNVPLNYYVIIRDIKALHT